MITWPAIPNDVIDWFRSVFSEVNRKISERIINVPNIRETSLDDGLVEALIPYSTPRILPSGTIVEMEIHNIGGLRRFQTWEIADIAVLVFVYRAERMLSQKIGLLQSKRLYPANNDIKDDDPEDFLYGMNRFLRSNPTSPLGMVRKRFEFTADCSYGALKSKSNQAKAINRLNEEFGEVVYYLFYNPPTVPVTVHYPVTLRQIVHYLPLGCRVYATKDVDPILAKLNKGAVPTLHALECADPFSNWRLETWAADLLLKCTVGQLFGEDRQEVVQRFLERRTGPIGAAIAVSITLAEG